MLTQVDPSELIERALRQYGSWRALAEACGVTAAALTNARSRGTISPELALAIHWATKGKVSAHELRPDLWRNPAQVPKRHRNGR